MNTMSTAYRLPDAKNCYTNYQESFESIKQYTEKYSGLHTNHFCHVAFSFPDSIRLKQCFLRA